MKKDIEPIKSEPHKEQKMVFNYAYERYEWLLRQSDLSNEDKNWMKNFENTEEYTQIYGGENEKAGASRG